MVKLKLKLTLKLKLKLKLFKDGETWDTTNNWPDGFNYMVAYPDYFPDVPKWDTEFVPVDPGSQWMTIKVVSPYANTITERVEYPSGSRAVLATWIPGEGYSTPESHTINSNVIYKFWCTNYDDVVDALKKEYEREQQEEGKVGHKKNCIKRTAI